MSGILDHQPAFIVRKLLIALGLGTEPALNNTNWPIQDTVEPDAPDNTITVYDTSGRKQTRTMNEGRVFELHGIQLRIRGINSGVGYAKARTLAVALDESVYQNMVTIGSSQYTIQNISRVGDVLNLGLEVPKSKRHIFTINAMACLRKIN